MRLSLVVLCAFISTALYAQSNSIEAKKKIVSAVKNAAESLTGDDCSVLAKLTDGELEINIEVFGPAEAVIFRSKATDEVVVKKAGTSASPSTIYSFLRNNAKVGSFEIVGYEDLSNTRFNLYNAANKLIRTCLYQE